MIIHVCIFLYEIQFFLNNWIYIIEKYMIK